MANAPLSVDALRSAVAAGTIDTVVVAIVDLQGRLQGKRLDASTSSMTCSSTAPRVATTSWPSTSR